MFSLLVSTLILYLSHTLITKSTYFRPILIIVPILLCLLLTRINAIPSVHGFLDIQDLRFSLSILSTLTTLVVITLLLLIIRLLLRTYSTGFDKIIFALPLSSLIILVAFILMFFAIYLMLVLTISLVKPIQGEFISSIFLLILIIFYLTSGYSSLLFYPALEGLVFSIKLSNKKLRTQLGAVHMLLIPTVLFMYILSHIYFVNFYISNSSITHHDNLVILKLLTLNSQI